MRIDAQKYLQSSFKSEATVNFTKKEITPRAYNQFLRINL